jgi:tyrosinase
LHLERFLQAVDPSVTIPYWKYDVPAPNVLHEDFMGRTGANAPIPEETNAVFSASNPLAGWLAPGVASGGIRRRPRYNQVTESPANTPPGNNNAITDAAALASGTNFTDILEPYEANTHGPAHTNSGRGGSWINDLDLAVRDPLFFLLHANVDRLWSRWQWLNNRFDPTATNPDNALVYDRQGLFPTVAPFGADRIAEYADETMWPWNGKINSENPGTTLDDRPATAPGGAFPQVTGVLFSPVGNPRVKDLVDYRADRLFTTSISSGFGFAYDDTPY